MPENTYMFDHAKDDSSIQNIELGCGCGNFGQVFYPKCYLIDNNVDLTTNCNPLYINFLCSAYDLPWENDRFEMVIICNPWNYGFSDPDESSILLAKELNRVLRQNGILTILGNKYNKYCIPQRIKKTLDNCGIKYQIIEEISSDDLGLEYYEGYIFKSSSGISTIVNVRLMIKIEKLNEN